MHLSEIWIYPIKSLTGIQLHQVEVFEKGLQYDRRWLLVDSNGRFITQRSHPQMALFRVSLTEDGLLVQYPGYGAISIPFHSPSQERIPVQVWDDQLEAILVNLDLSNWFTEILKQPVQLVSMPTDSKRLVDERYAHNQETVSFADDFPFLLISQASLDDLNSRMEEPVSMRRFRPNFVVSGFEAFQEDTIQEIRIGDVPFSIVKPCARCILTTIDPDTAVRGKEPLFTLAKYRKAGNKVLFGQNLLFRSSGVVTTNDPITILQ